MVARPCKAKAQNFACRGGASGKQCGTPKGPGVPSPALPPIDRPYELHLKWLYPIQNQRNPALLMILGRDCNESRAIPECRRHPSTDPNPFLAFREFTMDFTMFSQMKSEINTRPGINGAHWPPHPYVALYYKNTIGFFEVQHSKKTITQIIMYHHTS